MTLATDVKKIKTDGYDREENVIIPPVDIYETENEYVITADMPAVKKEDVNVILHEDKLEITGTVSAEEIDADNLKLREYALCNYHRSFTVGNNIDNGKISAKMENGVLTLNLPKKEEVKPKKIQINVA